jgi:hypothetical protein
MKVSGHPGRLFEIQFCGLLSANIPPCIFGSTWLMPMGLQRVLNAMRNYSRTDEIKLSGSHVNSSFQVRTIMHKEGEKLIIEVAPRKSLLAVLPTLSPPNEDFPSISDPIPSPVDL